ncbi:hypothetical protein Aph01nite_64820 [Acrocarpospora phusangensis]|uniref:Uncharacterized protein n=1 Tax=Acrocarpospora phusangensis TaxID=1070424 RepID=A0A919URL4_9ACTN|nr:hypothetical protein [Acrocarpospora phusangensis]GIH28172.1 hypothetical protein Aph01nite_64820 [Acrocarpospora phusangensis]
MIYQHAVRGADKSITDAIDRHISSGDDEDDEGTAGVLVPIAYCTLIARKIEKAPETIKARVENCPLTWAFVIGAGDGNRTRAVSLGIIC